jgi:hypothetical protein
MSHFKWIIVVLAVVLFGLAGCSSNTSSSSGYGSGSGYSINLTATQTVIPLGGQTTLIAAVKDSQGNPVNDSTNSVQFTSTLGGAFSSTTKIVGGVCSTIYTAPSSSASSTGTTTTISSGVDQVTASYQGAVAYVSIYAYAR